MEHAKLSNLEQKTDEELHERLQTLEAQIAADPHSKKSQRQRQEQVMDMLHEYNDIKDATQIILGALANIQGVMLKQIHMQYNLPLKEE